MKQFLAIRAATLTAAQLVGARSTVAPTVDQPVGPQDNNVPTKSIVYQGFGGIGHGPSKPKSHRATLEHNLEWFDQYLFQSTTKPSTEQR